MKIPSRWFPFVETCAGGIPAAGKLRARAEQLLEEHEASRARRLVRSLPRRKAEAADHAGEVRATKAVRRAVASRASGRCEATGADGTKLHMDHFFGRARSETVETCWMLSPAADFDKTHNIPSRRFWLLRFRRHAALHGYGRAIAMVDQQLALEQAQHPTPERSPK